MSMHNLTTPKLMVISYEILKGTQLSFDSQKESWLNKISWLNNNLSWSDHNICSKTWRLVCLLFLQFYNYADTSKVIMQFKSGTPISLRTTAVYSKFLQVVFINNWNTAYDEINAWHFGNLNSHCTQQVSKRISILLCGIAKIAIDAVTLQLITAIVW